MAEEVWNRNEQKENWAPVDLFPERHAKVTY